jgi:hypothetical protein
MLRHGPIAVLLVAALVGAADAQQCNDFDQCTVNDMCFADRCNGTFADGAGCDDGNGCTVNDRCQIDILLGEVCRGDTAPQGTSCGGGCGTCLPAIGSPELMLCGGDEADEGKPCDFSDAPCVDATCFMLEGLATCLPRPRVCPDTDGNPCTDNCDFATDTCKPNAPKCIPTCERCDPSTGACEPDHLFEACDDSDVCSTLTRCEFNQGADRTFCVAGVPIGPSPTRTAVLPTRTASFTPTLPPTATRTPTRTPTLTATAVATRTATAVATRTVSPSVTRTTSPTPRPTSSRTATSTVLPTSTGLPTPTARATSTVPTLPVPATRTASPTRPSTPIATATDTAALATPTHTASPPLRACVGDCDGNRAVAINEMLVGINIALGLRTVDSCLPFDSDASGSVEIYELLAAVSAIVIGCPQ